MRLRRRRTQPGDGSTAVAADPFSSPPTDGGWEHDALQSLPAIWLHLDSQARVLHMSRAARETFADLRLPEGLVAVTRSVEIESRAHQVLAGEPGPWELESPSLAAVLRLHGVPVSDGALLYFDDITELHRLEAVRADFVANLAHELRTPVASLSLAAETLAAGVSVEEQPRFVERISQEANYIGGILKTVTELASLEGPIELSVSDFWLSDVVLQSWRRVVDAQGSRSLTDLVPKELVVRGDRVKVAEILQNLLENAHRYSPNGAAVEVGAEPEEESIHVWVTDDGPGIPPADLPRIFERFYKVDRARTRRGDGSGLGLAISKHLVSAHSGRIWATAGPRGGTIVNFTLPKGV